MQLEQPQCLRSEDTPHRLMITHTIKSYWIPCQKKTMVPSNLGEENSRTFHGPLLHFPGPFFGSAATFQQRIYIEIMFYTAHSKY